MNTQGDVRQHRKCSINHILECMFPKRLRRCLSQTLIQSKNPSLAFLFEFWHPFGLSQRQGAHYSQRSLLFQYILLTGTHWSSEEMSKESNLFSSHQLFICSKTTEFFGMISHESCQAQLTFPQDESEMIFRPLPPTAMV